MRNFLQVIWWNDLNQIPKENRKLLIIRKGMHFWKIEEYNSNFKFPNDCIAWCYMDETQEVVDKIARENS